MINRLQHEIAASLSRNDRLPAVMVIILEKDIIEFANTELTHAGTVYGVWTEWLVNELKTLIENKLEKLPLKAIRKNELAIYWVLTPNHRNYSFEMQAKISKFNSCLEAAVKPQSNMHTIKFKECWDYDFQNLVCNDKITSEGLFRFWEAVDASVQFNVLKRRDFLSRAIHKVTKHQSSGTTSQSSKPSQTGALSKAGRVSSENDIPNFFRRHHNNEQCLWSRRTNWREDARATISQRKRQEPRFLLPKLNH